MYSSFSSAAESNWCTCASVAVVREDQRVRRRLRVGLRQLLLRALHRRDVVDVRGDPRGDSRVVHGVHVRRRRRTLPPVGMSMLSVQIIPPSFGIAHLSFGLSARSWTMSPDHATRRRECPVRQRLGVVVAVKRRSGPSRRPPARASIAALKDSSVTAAGSSPFASMTSPTVSAISMQHRHLALELRVLEELLDRRHRPGDVLVPRDPGHARLPRQRVLAVRVERRARLRVDEVRDVRDEAPCRASAPSPR